MWEGATQLGTAFQQVLLAAAAEAGNSVAQLHEASASDTSDVVGCQPQVVLCLIEVARMLQLQDLCQQAGPMS